MEEKQIKLFALCDGYELFNSIQFPYDKWFIDIQSSNKYLLSHIKTSINLPYSSNLTNDDIIDILDSNMGKYSNIKKIYFVSNDESCSNYLLYYVRIRRIILNNYSINTDSTTSSTSSTSFEFIIYENNFDKFKIKYPYLCTDNTANINPVHLKENQNECDEHDGSDEEESKSSTHFTISNIHQQQSDPEDGSDGSDDDDHNGSDNNSQSQSVDDTESDSFDIWNDHFGDSINNQNHHQRINEIIQFKSYPNQIINNKIYLGDIDHAYNKQLLLNLGITHIINCTEKFQNKFENDIDLNIKYIKISINDNDTENISKYFNITYNFINNALNESVSNKILIHCFAGISRSATILISYLMKYKQLKYNEAKEFVKQKRNIIQPNISFVKQLQHHEKYLFMDLSDLL